jgi:pimeloyl-ACP methyl ester carboxylesterase
MVSPVSLGNDPRLLGLLHAPVNKGPRAALVIFNSGLLHRAGPHRLPVLLGRKLAEAGFVTLRFDQNGIGDSPRRPGSHHAGVVKDCGVVLTELERRWPGMPVILMGLCAGADDVLAVSHDHPGVAGLILLDGYAPRTVRYQIAYWYWRLTRLDAWKRLPHKFRERRATPLPLDDEEEETNLRDWAEPQVMLARFNALKARNIPMLAVFTGAVRDYYSYEGQLAAAIGGAGNLTELMLAHCNHLYELTAHRTELIDHVCRWLDARWPTRT